MNFVSWEFLFLAIVVLGLRFTLGREGRQPAFQASVMVASTLFVAWHIPIYIFIMLTSIAVDYWAASGIHRAAKDSKSRQLYLTASIVTNLGLLGFFKYHNFAMEKLEVLASFLGFHWNLPRSALPLPMGISFYTFCSLSYTIDVYRGKIQTTRNFFDFYYFITFFPHLVAGPIIRAEQFIYQYYRRRSPHLKVINTGIYFIVRGLFLKMVCADNLGYLLQALWPAAYKGTLTSGSTWLMVFMFSAQIFYDFEGYTSIARGLAYLIGFKFPENFNNPYIATSFKNFWERWHMTLSTWLRDYLYVPLGGNRGSKLRTCANLMIVMVLGGLWHGANLTFVVWGFLHGLGLVVERLLGMHRQQKLSVVTRCLWFLVVQSTVLIAWVIFRSEHFPGAWRIITTLVSLEDLSLSPTVTNSAILLVPILMMHLYGLGVENGFFKPVSDMTKAALTGLMLYLTLAAYGTTNDFIYFAF